MKRRELSDVHPGQIWRDRDRRMASGNRRVRVMSTIREDTGKCFVTYRQIGSDDCVFDQVFRSCYERFQRAFDLLRVTQEEDGQ